MRSRNCWKRARGWIARLHRHLSLTAISVMSVALMSCSSQSVARDEFSVPWTLKDASRAQIVEGLRTCLADLGIKDADATGKLENEWSKIRAVPEMVDDPQGTVFHANPDSPVLIVRRATTEKRDTCSVVFAADLETSNDAVDDLGAEYAASRFQTPHGWVWRLGSLIISNDYGNGYRFEPAVFEEDAFFSGYNDIRIYRCKETC